ncbi:hypothetical protein PAPYR_5360 [Paratrimastix pyriformis]|uniref:Uncharacterized protein n=1 Tax=Paratrimastix pyriformis TaxID=342808 RepID=A0ABQ8UHZ6_9EUKA|nr:hypothetical protein PAPYR_5360 [Paratrimastix pyriformis]
MERSQSYGRSASADPKLEEFRQVVCSLRFPPESEGVMLSYTAADLQDLSNIYPSLAQLAAFFEMHGHALRSVRLANCVLELFHPGLCCPPREDRKHKHANSLANSE